MHFSAAMVNLSYRSSRQVTKEEQSRARKCLRKRLESIFQLAVSSPLIYNNIDDDHEHDNEDYFTRYVDNPPTSRKQDEASRYLKSEHREISTPDILKFWKTMAKFLPSLTKLAFQVLPVPATSASVERSFSAAGQVVFERRSNISPDVVDDIVFLRSFKKSK